MLSNLSGASAMADQPCTSLADCRNRADANIAAGRYEQALEELVATTTYASFDGSREDLRGALESLTAVNLKLGNPLMAHAWAQAELMTFHHDARALANLETVTPALKAMVPPAGISGTYKSYAGYGRWSELKIRDEGGGKVQTDWYMIRFGSVQSADDIGPAAEWALLAEGQYTNSEFLITYEGWNGTSCTLDFKRNALAIERVSENKGIPQNCLAGGAGVAPHGPYWLVDTAVPDLDR